ncbi:hypothetical protein ACVWZL_005778 [Bradyrhizobium sp. GM2.4]
MTSRADKLGRMVSLLKLQLRLSEWQLAHLRQQERSLQDEQEWLVGTLNEGKPPAGSSSESIARRLTRASVGARAIQAQASQQLDQVRTESRRVKQFEQVAKAALADKGWSVRQAYEGIAILQGPNGVVEAVSGQQVPGLGRIEEIKNENGRLVVESSGGVIYSSRKATP